MEVIEVHPGGGYLLLHHCTSDSELACEYIFTQTALWHVGRIRRRYFICSSQLEEHFTFPRK